MTGKGHKIVGVSLALSVSPLILTVFEPLALSFYVAAAFLGATAPDWLEIRVGGSTLIPHRTITHITLVWAILLAFSLLVLSFSLFDTVLSLVVSGFALGGLSHCIADMGTPMGVPLMNPNKRFSFKLYTDKTEVFPITLVCGLSAIFFTLTQFVAVNIE